MLSCRQKASAWFLDESDLENVAGVVQIVHGMEEHKERYYDFALFLAEHGMHVVVSDLRSHGEYAPVLSHIADRRGDQLLIRDQQPGAGRQ